jgi:hypothetical protein
MCRRKHQMKMIHTIFRLRKWKAREKWKVIFIVASIKVNKFNIGTIENPKMASIGN